MPRRKRAHDADGHFSADDKSTPDVNEAYADQLPEAPEKVETPVEEPEAPATVEEPKVTVKTEPSIGTPKTSNDDFKLELQKIAENGEANMASGQRLGAKIIAAARLRKQ